MDDEDGDEENNMKNWRISFKYYCLFTEKSSFFEEVKDLLDDLFLFDNISSDYSTDRLLWRITFN